MWEEIKLYYRFPKKQIKRCLLYLFLCLFLTVVLGIVITFGLISHPEIVFFAFLSFALVLLPMMFSALIIGIVQHIILRKNFPTLLKRSYDRNLSSRERFQSHLHMYNKAKRNKYLQRLSTIEIICGISWLSVWVLIMILVTVGAIFFKNQYLIEFLNKFKY